MKKLFYAIPLALIFLSACGGGGGTQEESTEETAEAGGEAVEAKGDVTDLSDYGMPYSIVIPNASSAEIAENAWGGVEIRSGEGFMITLEFGEGNMELLKSDLNDDAIFKSEILDEGENYIVYKRSIPDDDTVKPQVHFFYVGTFGEDVIEVKNLMDVEYGEEAIQKMLASAKTLSAAGGA